MSSIEVLEKRLDKINEDIFREIIDRDDEVYEIVKRLESLERAKGRQTLEILGLKDELRQAHLKIEELNRDLIQRRRAEIS